MISPWPSDSLIDFTSKAAIGGGLYESRAKEQKGEVLPSQVSLRKSVWRCPPCVVNCPMHLVYVSGLMEG